ncbi:MAG: DUF3800 domain-containing protein [Pseudolysinimonas sp.]
MLYAFIDESYSKDFYYVGAFIVPESNLPDLREAVGRVQVFASTFGVDPTVELHAHSIMSGSEGWTALRGRHRAAMAIYRFALTELARLPGKVVVRGVNVEGLASRYRNPMPPHAIALSHALEDVDAFAKSIGEGVVVIADELPDQLDHARRVERYQLVGTGGYRSSRLESIEPPIQFGSSAESPGLQAVDLIVYLFRRKDSHVESNPVVSRGVRELWSLLGPLKPRTWRWNP